MNEYDSIAAKRLGVYLSQLRKKRKMTGAQLGNKIGISQSKISKIEDGQQPLLSGETLLGVLEALEATPSDRKQINLLAAQANISSYSVGFFHYHYDTDWIINLQEKSKNIWIFTTNVIPTLLQIMDYREAHIKHIGLRGSELKDSRNEALRRQDMLWNNHQKYYIFFLENTLYALPSTIAVQLAQLDRLERMIERSNASYTIGIIPLEAESSLIPSFSYAVYDKNIVVYEAGPKDVVTEEVETVTYASGAFEVLKQTAYTGNDAKLLIRKAIDYFQVRQ